MGARSSKSKKSAEEEVTFSKKKFNDGVASKRSRSFKNRKKSKKSSSGGSEHSDLGEEDVTLVKIDLAQPGKQPGDRRLSQAQELINSGRPISVQLDAVEDKNKGKDGSGWDDDDSRLKWKDQLSLMRHFYDWEEIPLDFFVDQNVGGEKNRRLSIQITALDVSESNNGTSSLEKQGKEEEENKPPLPHQRSETTTTKQKPELPARPEQRTRSASVAVPNYTSKLSSPKTPTLQPMKETNEELEAGSKQTEDDAPTALPSPEMIRPSTSAGGSSVRKPRAASIAIGESFAAAIHQQNVKASKQEDTSATSFAQALSNKTPMDVLKEVDASSRARTNSVAGAQDQVARERRLSTTSIDSVYGRLGRQSHGVYDRFEIENPVLAPSDASSNKRRTSVNSPPQRTPEQFTKLSANINPEQFARERRNTRTGDPGIRRSTVQKKNSSPRYSYASSDQSTKYPSDEALKIPANTNPDMSDFI